MNIQTGQLVYTTTNNYFLVQEDTAINLKWDIDIEDAPIEQYVELELGKEKNGVVEVIQNLSPITMMVKAPVTRQEPAIIRCAAFGRRIDQNRCDYYAIYTENFWAQVSDGRWDLEYIGVAMPEEYRDISTEPPFYGLTSMKEVWYSEENRPWQPTHWHMLGGSSRNNCGVANLNGNIGRTNADDPFCQRLNETMCHEKGHNFGSGHSNILRPDNTSNAYADKSSVMASAKKQMGIHAPQAYHLGLYDHDEVRYITKSTRFRCAPAELPRDSRHKEETAINIVDVGTPYPLGQRGKVFVSTRRPKGYPWGVRDDDNVWIHIGSTTTHRVDVLAPGESCTRFDGLTITHEKRLEDSSVVLVQYHGEPDPGELRIVEREFPPTNRQMLNPKDAGLWYNPNMRGQGIGLQYRTKDFRGQWNMYWYTFEDTNTSPKKDWYLAVWNQNEYQFDIVTASGGYFQDPTEAKTEVVGGGQMTIDSQGNLIFNYETKMHGRGTLTMEKLVSQDQRDGAFFNPKRKGEGFLLHHINDRILAYFYTFDSRGNRAWYLLDGKLVDSIYKCDILEAEGQFNRFNRKLEFIKTVGEARIQTTSDNQKLISILADDMVLNTTVQRIF